MFLHNANEGFSQYNWVFGCILGALSSGAFAYMAEPESEQNVKAEFDPIIFLCSKAVCKHCI